MSCTKATDEFRIIQPPPKNSLSDIFSPDTTSLQPLNAPSHSFSMNLYNLALNLCSLSRCTTSRLRLVCSQCLRQRLLSGQTILGVTAAVARRTATKFKLQTALILCGLLAAWVSRHNAGANNVAALSGSQL